MNFKHMPELVPAWAYPVVGAATLVLTYLTFRWCRQRGLF
jgi:Mg2+ and Co2+ transporter CorA